MRFIATYHLTDFGPLTRRVEADTKTIAESELKTKYGDRIKSLTIYAKEEFEAHKTELPTHGEVVESYERTA